MVLEMVEIGPAERFDFESRAISGARRLLKQPSKGLRVTRPILSFNILFPLPLSGRGVLVKARLGGVSIE
jgi:hypothetical protein